MAYHYCYVPPERPVTLMTLVRVACLRWPVEEDFEFGKDHFGLDHSQVRHYTALHRHIVLTMAALAVGAVTAARERTQAPRPNRPDEEPPADTGLIALTVAEIKRLFTLLTRTHHPRNTTCTGPSGDDATKHAPDGSTTKPDSTEIINQHD